MASFPQCTSTGWRRRGRGRSCGPGSSVSAWLGSGSHGKRDCSRRSAIRHVFQRSHYRAPSPSGRDTESIAKICAPCMHRQSEQPLHPSPLTSHGGRPARRRSPPAPTPPCCRLRLRLLPILVLRVVHSRDRLGGVRARVGKISSGWPVGTCPWNLGLFHGLILLVVLVMGLWLLDFVLLRNGLRWLGLFDGVHGLFGAQ